MIGYLSAEGYEMRLRQLQRPIIQSYTARCGPGGVTGLLGSYDNRGMCQVGKRVGMGGLSMVSICRTLRQEPACTDAGYTVTCTCRCR